MKEATARIKINKLLEGAGWRFLADTGGPATVQLEPSVQLTNHALDALGPDFEKVGKGFVDFLLLNEKGFPIMNLTGIFCLHSGALLKSTHADHQTHETNLFRQLWGVLNPGELVFANRGFCSFGIIAGLAGAVLTRDGTRAQRTIRKLRTGVT